LAPLVWARLADKRRRGPNGVQNGPKSRGPASQPWLENGDLILTGGRRGVPVDSARGDLPECVPVGVSQVAVGGGPSEPASGLYAVRRMFATPAQSVTACLSAASSAGSLLPSIATSARRDASAMSAALSCRSRSSHAHGPRRRRRCRAAAARAGARSPPFLGPRRGALPRRAICALHRDSFAERRPSQVPGLCYSQPRAGCGEGRR